MRKRYGITTAVVAVTAAVALTALTSGCGTSEITEDQVVGVEYQGTDISAFAFEVAAGPNGSVWVTPTGWGPGPYQLVDLDDDVVDDVVTATTQACADGVVVLTARLVARPAFTLASGESRPTQAVIGGHTVQLRSTGQTYVMAVNTAGALAGDVGQPAFDSNGAVVGMYAGNATLVLDAAIRAAVDDHGC